MNPKYNLFRSVRVSSESFPEVTSIFFAEIPNEEKKRRATSSYEPEKRVTQALLQYGYDTGRYDKEEYEELRGIPCSDENPCTKGELWKFGKLKEPALN